MAFPWLRFLFCLTLVVPQSSGFARSEVAGRAPPTLAQTLADDRAVLAVGFRLSAAAADLCVPPVPGIGIAVHGLDQYAPAYRAAAAMVFARAGFPGVLAVAPAGPAARAGVAPGDAILAVAGAPVAGSTDLAAVEELLARIDAAARRGAVRLDLARGGSRIVAMVVPVPTCGARFQVRAERALNAFSDGSRIEVTTGLLRYLHGPDELAAVLAHELAHVVLHHRGRAAAGAGSRAAEAAADRMSVRLIARAGYAPAALLSFWSRIEREHGGGLFAARSHPHGRARVAAIGAEIARLGAEPPR